MDLIEFIRMALLVFDGAGLLILAMYPTQRDVEHYRDWIGYLDKEYRERRENGGKPGASGD